jgi:hypothetical protein
MRKHVENDLREQRSEEVQASYGEEEGKNFKVG